MERMEKLIELLNEYGNEICNHWGNYQTDMDFTDRDTYWYLSKKFGFIKWLVENDKIDYEKVRSGEGNGSRWHFETVQPEYYIIMLLAIQDEPIEFLISILK